MIKRAFKLKNQIEFDKIDVNILQRDIIDYGTYIVMDKDTLALQIITHIAGRKEYVILIPGRNSFIILNISEKSRDVLLKALKKIGEKIPISNEALKEIRAIMDIYLFIDTFDKGIIKSKVKDIIEKNIEVLSKLDKRLLKNLLPCISESIVNIVLEDLFYNTAFPKKALEYFDKDELKRIFLNEIMITDAYSYALRLLKSHLRESLN